MNQKMYRKRNVKLIATVFFCGVFTLLFNNTSFAQLGKLTNKIKSSSNSKQDKTEGSKINNVGTSEVGIPTSNVAATKVFDENKENLLQSYDFLTKFNAANGYDVVEYTNSVSSVMKLAENTIANLKKNITDISEFEKSNSEAKEMHLNSKIGWLETALEKAKDKFGGIKTSMLKDIEDDVEWLGSTEASLQYASPVMDKLDNMFKTLDNLFPGDNDVNASKKVNLPKAKSNYDKLMKQVAQNRMEASKYAGSNKAELEKRLAAAYTKRYPQDVVKRIVIVDPEWKQRTELKDNNQNLYWETANFIGVHVAVQKEKVCNVYIMTFKKSNKTGEIEPNSVGTNYPVLIENINK